MTTALRHIYDLQGINHPTEGDFYLLSHEGIQGTSRYLNLKFESVVLLNVNLLCLGLVITMYSGMTVDSQQTSLRWENSPSLLINFLLKDFTDLFSAIVENKWFEIWSIKVLAYYLCHLYSRCTRYWQAYCLVDKSINLILLGPSINIHCILSGPCPTQHPHTTPTWWLTGRASTTTNWPWPTTAPRAATPKEICPRRRRRRSRGRWRRESARPCILYNGNSWRCLNYWHKSLWKGNGVSANLDILWIWLIAVRNFIDLNTLKLEVGLQSEFWPSQSRIVKSNKIWRQYKISIKLRVHVQNWCQKYTNYTGCLLLLFLRIKVVKFWRFTKSLQSATHFLRLP